MSHTLRRKHLLLKQTYSTLGIQIPSKKVVWGVLRRLNTFYKKVVGSLGVGDLMMAASFRSGLVRQGRQMMPLLRLGVAGGFWGAMESIWCGKKGVKKRFQPPLGPRVLRRCCLYIIVFFSFLSAITIIEKPKVVLDFIGKPHI